MGENRVIAEHFAIAEERIRELRTTDQSFDEICADYLQLQASRAVEDSATQHTNPNFVSSVRESLIGLKEEIEIALQNSTTRSTE